MRRNRPLPATGPAAEKPMAFKMGMVKRGVKTVAPMTPAPIPAIRVRPAVLIVSDYTTV